MRRLRSLRLWVSLAAAVVIAVPVAVIVVLAAFSLRDAAIRTEAAPGAYRAMCSSLAEELPADQQGPDVVPWAIMANSQECAFGDESFSTSTPVVMVPSKAIRPGDVSPRHVGSGATIACVAEYHSTNVTPELSSWPLTDPDRIRVRLTAATGGTGVGELTGGVVPAEHRVRLSNAQRTLNTQISLLIGGATALVGLAAGVVWLASGWLLRPVEAIRRQMADITAHDLARRVPVPRACVEMADLATTVNATLDRLQVAVEDNQRFVADASHELRSPITALRAELEIATAHPDQADWPAVVDAALADTERLQSLATDLLLLARLDHAPATTATTDLADLVRDHTTHRRTRHTLTVEAPDRPVPVRGRRALLERLLRNVLDNAERHATTTITVRLTTTGNEAVLEVLDDGPGIPPADRDRVFNRFTRLDDARTRDTGGTGLGLPIARRIATTHGGTLHATDRVDHGGARLVATLPRA
ncbi:MAG: HAMP domain-containing histidine kinase [Saccharothrix sp.]|nr:HAMP domain-containing histidine kinase [Saccharothrix sp.]